MWDLIVSVPDHCLSFYFVPIISGTIQRKSMKLSSEHLEHLVNSVELADSIPSENESSTIELLIGNDVYLDLILSQKIEIQPGWYLLGSKLGWILTGRTTETSCDRNESHSLILTYGSNITKTEVFISVDTVIPKPDLEDFWNVEGIGITDNPNCSDDEKALEQFNETLKFEDGRYQVTWPWKEENPDLPANRELSVGRLKSVVSKLKYRPELLQKYNSVLTEQLEKGVIERIEETSGRLLQHHLPSCRSHFFEVNNKTSNCINDASAKTSVYIEDLCYYEIYVVYF